jgi:hypothetical protein
MRFVFLSVGLDSFYPKLLVNSIRRVMPDAEIIQCSDPKTPKIERVDQLRIFDEDTGNLMKFRLSAFSQIGLNEPAIYLDTDMLVLKECHLNEILTVNDVILCQRSFEKENLFNTKPFLLNDLIIKKFEYNEYENLSIFDVFPYIACFNLVKNYAFWDACYKELLKLDEKYHFWYGDQESIKRVISTGKFLYRTLPEYFVACLPEHVDFNKPPALIHFKGAHRKKMMLDAALMLGLDI